jgi:hypothetical protein
MLSEILDLLAPGQLAEGRPACPYEALIGSWDIVSRLYAEDGSVQEEEGEWHFTWIQGGWAVQDVLFIKGAPPEQRGTTIRCFDEAADCWRVIWIPSQGAGFAALAAWTAEGMIVQDVEDAIPRERFTISNITPFSFNWRNEISHTGGADWHLAQEMRAVRRG